MISIWVVGWRAYTNYQTIAIGRDIFPARSKDAAILMAARRVPYLIGVLDCDIGIRYIKEKK